MVWDQTKETLLRSLFESGEAPLENLTAPIIKEVFNKHDQFQHDYSVKNFYPLYRRKASEFITNRAQSQGRRTYTVV